MADKFVPIHQIR